MKTYFLLSILFLSIICASCAKETVADSISINEPSMIPQIFELEAKITSDQVEGVKTTQTIFNQKENNSKIYFVDKDNGWLIGNTVSEDRDVISSNLYKTEDGGKTWKKVPIKVQKEARFENIFFINQSLGWVNTQKYGSYNPGKAISRLIKTTDGGKTWQELSVQEFTTIQDIKFIDETNGWMTGSTDNPENVYDSKQFLRKTSDGGNSWTETGKKLFEKNGFEDRDARQNITGFIAETPENLEVVMWSGKLFKTFDGGENWEQFGPQFDFPMQTTPDNFGKLGKSDRLRMARGTWSIEGIYSYFATEKNGDWTIRWTDKALCVYDIFYLSDNEMISVGRLGKNIYEKDEQINGVILYSSDGGANWKTVYRNESIIEINSIAQISENHFMAVGNDGLVVNIEFEKK